MHWKGSRLLHTNTNHSHSHHRQTSWQTDRQTLLRLEIGGPHPKIMRSQCCFDLSNIIYITYTMGKSRYDIVRLCYHKSQWNDMIDKVNLYIFILIIRQQLWKQNGGWGVLKSATVSIINIIFAYFSQDIWHNFLKLKIWSSCKKIWNFC